MSRRVRFFLKKRGSRRTGSQQTGSFGWMLFLASLFVGGWLLLIFMVRTEIVPEWRANRHFRPHTCTVLTTRVGEKTTDEGKLYRPEVKIQYELDGQEHTIWTYNIAQFKGGGYSSGQEDKEAVIARFTAGQEFPCWYDPDRPSVAVVYRSRAWLAWAMLLLPASFITISGSGLGYAWFNWGASAERRASLARQAQRAVQLDRFDPTVMASSEYPFIPTEADLTNSPGVHLAYRLPVSNTVAGAMASLIVGTVLWNLVGLFFLILMVQSFVRYQPEWLLAAIAIPFAVAGGYLIRYTVRRVGGYAGLGPTLLEISGHPLHPGGTYTINLSQSGWLDLRMLEVVLACDERATFQQGTNSRTNTRRVYETTVLRFDKPSIRPETSLEAEVKFTVPAHAMHSFRSGHNEVCWRLIVRGEGPGRPPFERDFLLVVRPSLQPLQQGQAA
ncbi:MAG: DUF3592 domain-containing protein [Pirellulales bacterium]